MHKREDLLRGLTASGLLFIWMVVALVGWPGTILAGPAQLEKFDHGLRSLAATEWSPNDPDYHKPVQAIIRWTRKPDQRDQKKVSALGGQVGDDFPSIQAFSAVMPQGKLRELSNNPEITSISEDLPVRAALDVTRRSVGADLAEGLGYTGRGVGVAVVDSGIYWGTWDFTQEDTGSVRIVGWADFLNRKNRPYDDCGHGTHVASILGGNGRDSTTSTSTRIFRGLAPQVNLIGVKVLDQYGAGRTRTVLAGLQWCIDHKTEYNLRVINLSLGHPPRESFQTDPLCRMVEAAWKAGIVVVCSAGNYGAEGYGTICSPGTSPYALTVGAMNVKGTDPRSDDVICSFSSRGPTLYDHVLKPDLVAPGNRINATGSWGSYFDVTYPDNRLDPGTYDPGWLYNWDPYFELSGTSMAAPVVSGAAALLIQQDPTLTPDDVKGRLMVTAEKRSGWNVFVHGAGYLDLPAAMASTFRIVDGHAWSPVVYRGRR
jgi:serine protease AprX